MTQQEESNLNIKDILVLYLSKWGWFVLSVAICISLAVLYLLKTPYVYTVSSSLLIENNDKGSSVSSDLNFADMGLFKSSTNVNNEIIAMKSPSLMQEVVTRLNLTMNYNREGRFHNEVLYGTSLPISAKIEGLSDNQSARFSIHISPDGRLELYGFILNGAKFSDAAPVSDTLHARIDTPIGIVTISPTAFYKSGTDMVIHISKSSLQGATSSYTSRLNVNLLQREATVVNLSITDVSVQRAQDVINTLISAYNERWVEARNQIAVSTSVFINERLKVIEQELGVVEEDISTYKSKNLISDLQTASDSYVDQSNRTEVQIMEINNRLYMVKYISDYLNKGANTFKLLPAGTGIESSSIESQISEYNSLLLQRNNLVSNSSTTNPLVTDMDHTLTAMRGAILSSLNNYTVMLETQLNTLKQQEAKATDRIAATPDQAKYLLSVERQQKVKEALYLFLLQKREENELSQAFTAYNTRIITPPTGGSLTSPNSKLILLISLIIGLVIPMVIIFLIEVSNTRVRGKKDLEKLSVPYIGEIPQYDKTHSKLQFQLPDTRKTKKRKNEKITVLVKEGDRNIINEAFRVVRTNLEFMVSGKSGANVFMTTSFNPGSGKTFVTANMAMSLAVKGKKILVIDGDMRHGSISAIVGYPKLGLSDWLSSRLEDLHKAIVPSGLHECLSILPCGTIPPNPTELLQDDRLKQMIDSLRTQYDYILIDCPPVNIVADTQIIGKVADRTVFIVRAGLLEKAMLPELENDFKENKYPGMCVLLNGTASKGGRYGYRYGYQYGYNYRYGYYNS